MSAQGQYPTRRYTVPPAQELRFELENPTDALSLKVISGYAELFGIELVTGATYGFSHEQRGGVWVPGIHGEGAEVEMSPSSSTTPHSRTTVAAGLPCLRDKVVFSPLGVPQSLNEAISLRLSCVASLGINPFVSACAERISVTGLPIQQRRLPNSTPCPLPALFVELRRVGVGLQTIGPGVGGHLCSLFAHRPTTLSAIAREASLTSPRSVFST